MATPITLWDRRVAFNLVISEVSSSKHREDTSLPCAYSKSHRREQYASAAPRMDAWMHRCIEKMVTLVTMIGSEQRWSSGGAESAESPVAILVFKQTVVLITELLLYEWIHGQNRTQVAVDIIVSMFWREIWNDRFQYSNYSRSQDLEYVNCSEFHEQCKI